MSIQKCFGVVLFSLTVLCQNLFSQIILQSLVTDTESEPVQNALVELIDEKDHTRTFSAYTDAQGQYVIQIAETGVENSRTQNPDMFNLLQNYPNPFNPSTVIEYELAEPAHINIEIYNVLGQKIKTLFNGFQTDRIARVVWDGTNDMGQGITAGVYIYSLNADNVRINKKMLFIDGHKDYANSLLFQSMGTAASGQSNLNKKMSNHYLLRVTGNDIETYEQQNLVITDGMTLNLVVFRMNTPSDDLTVDITQQVTLNADNTPPTASFTVTPSSGALATVFSFDASGCSDNEDPVALLKVAWDWENDGTWDTNYSKTKTATHQYSTPGIKTVKLQVRDTGGLKGKTTLEVTVNAGNNPPTALFTVTPNSGTTTTVFSFDASGCSDNEDSVAVLQVRWDWENDGTWDTEYSTTKTATHQYTTNGTKTIKMEVMDSDSLTGNITQQVTLNADNTPPVASFTITPSSGTTITVFSFDASGCSDDQDPVASLKVAWDWENDGTWDTNYSRTKTATHQYSTPGTKTVKLQVRDINGLKGNTTQQVTVSADNTPPAALFTVTPDSGTTATVFSFDASGCSDHEDAVAALQVRWDWENDGTWDTDYSTSKTATFQYSTAGVWTINLEVKDTGGLTGSTTQRIAVSIANTPPSSPSNPDPPDNEIDTAINSNLMWNCNDLEGDVLTFDIYFGTSSNPPLVVSGYTSTNYTPGALNYSTQYYWKIVASDGKSITEGPIWTFMTLDNSAPSLNVTTPNGGETVIIDTHWYVRWDHSSGSGARVFVDLYKGGLFYKRLKTPDTRNDGTFDDMVTSDIVPGHDYKIRITSNLNPAIWDESDNYFSITNTPPPYIRVTSPDGGESVIIGTNWHVRWDYSPDSGARVFVDLYKGGQFVKRLKTPDTGNDGTFDDVVTSDIVPGNNYRIRINSKSIPGVWDDSNANFFIDTPGDMGTVTDIDGNVYRTVKIGNQWWMAENLKVTHYRNGDAIPNVTGDVAWDNLTSGAYCNYNNNEAIVATYGRLYNWYSVDDSRNIAPAGWHVPTDEEWQQLEMYLGMSQSVADRVGNRGTDEGGKMKESGTSHWNEPNEGATNESRFSALPCGYRYRIDGSFVYMAYHTYMWSSTERVEGSTWSRGLHFDSSDIYRNSNGVKQGFSVRCVRNY